MLIVAFGSRPLPAAPAAQEGGVDAILKAFADRRAKAKSAEEFRAAAREALAALDGWASKAKPDDPDLPRAAFHAGEMLLNLEDFEAALGRFEDIVRKYPDAKPVSADARFLAGGLCVQLGKDAQAREHLAAFVSRADPADERLPQGRILDAMTYANEGKYDDAVAALQALCKDYEPAWLNLAIVNHLAGRNDEAKRTLERAIKEASQTGLVELCKRLLGDWARIVGHPAPEPEGKDLSGADFRRAPGQATLLYFFSTEYEESAMEASLMRRLRAWFPEKDLAILGVAIDRRAGEVGAFVRETGITWPICVDGDGFDGPLARKFQVQGLPFVLVIDRKGVVRLFNPICTPYAREVKPAIERILAER